MLFSLQYLARPYSFTYELNVIQNTGGLYPISPQHSQSAKCKFIADQCKGLNFSCRYNHKAWSWALCSWKDYAVVHPLYVCRQWRPVRDQACQLIRRELDQNGRGQPSVQYSSVKNCWWNQTKRAWGWRVCECWRCPAHVHCSNSKELGQHQDTALETQLAGNLPAFMALQQCCTVESLSHGSIQDWNQVPQGYINTWDSVE